MIVDDETYIASFVPERGGYTGAIYAWHKGYGPQLLLCCDHHHDSMWAAMDCAAAQLKWATRVVELAEIHRTIEP